MLLKGIVEEDFINYKRPAMFVLFPKCSFKCEKECGVRCCQNSELALQPDTDISIEQIVAHYLRNDITAAIVLGGLEPLDSFDDVVELVAALRRRTNDPIIIYTGYNASEIDDKVAVLQQYSNMIIKFGRFIPNDKHTYDRVLGIELASSNQYAKYIS